MHKKKIGIITLNGYFNFGNRLQNYALTKVLENKGFDVYTLWHKNIKNIIIEKIKYVSFFMRKYDRFRKFYSFSKQNIKEKIWTQSNINKFDYFVVGSDQVWNYKLIDKDKTWFYAPENKVTISYSASLGTVDCPVEFKNKMHDMLKNYDAISVRESNAKDLVESFCNCNVEILIDPTLLLSKEEWSKVIKKPKTKIPPNYIFVYFLGEISQKNIFAIEKIASDMGYKIINILDKKSDFYDIGPSEFLFLINNAKLVCTDSFHACVFSFIFDVAFVIFKRFGEGISNDMYSRLENFITLFNLQNREFNGEKITQENLMIDYKYGKEKLKSEINKSNNFLDCYIK